MSEFRIPMGLMAALQTERPELLKIWLAEASAEGGNEMLLSAIEMLALQRFESLKRERALKHTLHLVQDAIKGVVKTEEVAYLIATEDIPDHLHVPGEIYHHFKESTDGHG